MVPQDMPQKERALGLLCGGCGVVSIALLALHPEVPAHNFPEVLKTKPPAALLTLWYMAASS